MTAIAPPSGFERYPATDATTASTLALAAGHVASNAPVNPKALFPLRGAQGFQMMIGGAGANNDTVDFRVWLVWYVYGVADTYGSRPVVGLVRRFFGSGTATFSATSLFIGGGASATAGRTADGMTWTLSTTATTPKGPGAVLEAAYGSPGSAVYSPADDTDPALLVVPHAAWADGVVVEFDPTGTSTGAHALIARM